MKFVKITAAVLLLCLFCTLFVACDEDLPVNDAKYVTVTLDYNDGTPPHAVKVESGKPMTKPIDPEREGYTFGGWKSNGREWKFEENALVNDVTLVATWISASSLFDYTLGEGSTLTLISYSGSIASVSIPETISGNTVVALGDGLFAELENRMMSSLTVPKTVVFVGDRALSGVKANTVTLLGVLEHVGEAAFKGCEGLVDVSLAEGMSSVPYDAFASTSLETVDIPESVSVIDENAFFGCSKLKTIVLPAGVEIRNGAFSGCSSLVTVFFLGNEAEWQEVLGSLDNGGGENDAIVNARVMFYSEDEPETEGEFWYRSKDGEPRGW